MNANLRRRVECRGALPSQMVKEAMKKKAALPRRALALLLLGLVGPMGHSTDAFTAYDCTNRSNIVESYFLLAQCLCHR
jgi:hypothetical protein